MSAGTLARSAHRRAGSQNVKEQQEMKEEKKEEYGEEKEITTEQEEKSANRELVSSGGRPGHATNHMENENIQRSPTNTMEADAGGGVSRVIYAHVSGEG